MVVELHRVLLSLGLEMQLHTGGVGWALFLVTWQRFCEHHPPSRRHLSKKKKAHPDDDVKLAPAHFREFIGLKLDVPSRIGKGGVQVKCDLPRMRAKVVQVARVRGCSLASELSEIPDGYQTTQTWGDRPLEPLDQWSRALYREHGPQRLRPSPSSRRPHLFKDRGEVLALAVPQVDGPLV